jgi:hypothetical protein
MAIKSGADSGAVAAERALQEMSSVDRSPSGLERAPQVDNGDSSPGHDDAYATPPQATEVQEQRTEQRRGPPLSPADQKRVDMQNRFRERRTQESEDAAREGDEISALTREAMAPGEAEEIREVEETRSTPPPEKRKHRLVVRGQEVELDDDQLIAAAQKNLAADTYLDEARATFDRAKALSSEIEAMRAGLQSGKHPAGTLPDTQTTVQTEPPVEQPDEATMALIREIQYGNPDDPETAKKLKAFMQANAVQVLQVAVPQELQKQREAAEVQRGQAALSEFNAANTELIKDDFAMAIMERRLFAHFLEDLQKVGFDTSKLKSNEDVATMHMRMRAAGHPVRSIKDVFDASKQDYLAWKDGAVSKPPSTEDSGAPPEQNPARTPPLRQSPQTPRIEVNVNRDVRRANIPTQPPRSSAPQRSPAAPDNQPRGDSVQARSQVAQGIIAQRRALRNGGRAS